MVKNPPSKAGVSGWIPGQGSKIPHAVGQVSPRTAARENPEGPRLLSPQTVEPVSLNQESRGRNTDPAESKLKIHISIYLSKQIKHVINSALLHLFKKNLKKAISRVIVN